MIKITNDSNSSRDCRRYQHFKVKVGVVRDVLHKPSHLQRSIRNAKPLTFFSFFLSRRCFFLSSSSCCCFKIRASRSVQQSSAKILVKAMSQRRNTNCLDGTDFFFINIKTKLLALFFKGLPCSVKLPTSFRFLRTSNRSWTYFIRKFTLVIQHKDRYN